MPRCATDLDARQKETKLPIANHNPHLQGSGGVISFNEFASWSRSSRRQRQDTRNSVPRSQDSNRSTVGRHRLEASPRLEPAKGLPRLRVGV